MNTVSVKYNWPIIQALYAIYTTKTGIVLYKDISNADLIDMRGTGRAQIIYDPTDDKVKISENNGPFTPIVQTIPSIPNFLSGLNMNVNTVGNNVTYSTISNPVFSNATIGGYDISTMGATVSTLSGYLNQDVKTTSVPIFSNATIAGYNMSTIAATTITVDGEVNTLMGQVSGLSNWLNQDVKTTALPNFIGVTTGKIYTVSSSTIFSNSNIGDLNTTFSFQNSSSSPTSSIDLQPWSGSSNYLTFTGTGNNFIRARINGVSNTPFITTTNTGGAIYDYMRVGTSSVDQIGGLRYNSGNLQYYNGSWNTLASQNLNPTFTTITTTGNATIGGTSQFTNQLTSLTKIVNGNPSDTSNVTFVSYGKASIMSNVESTATILNDPQQVLDLIRRGAPGISWNQILRFALSRGSNISTDAKTRADLYVSKTTDTDLVNVIRFYDSGVVYIPESLGINTVSPTERLDVTGNARISGTASISSNTTIGGILSTNTINSSNFVLQNPNTGSNNSLFTIKSGSDTSSFSVGINAWSDGSITNFNPSGTNSGSHRIRARINSVNDTEFISITNNGALHNYFVLGTSNMNVTGAVRYNGGNIEYYNGSSWQTIIAGSSPTLSSLTVTGNLTVNGSNRANYGDFNNLNSYTDSYMKVNNRFVGTQFASEGDAYNYFTTLGGRGFMQFMVGNGSPSGIGSSDYGWAFAQNNATGKRYYQLSSTSFFTGQHCVKSNDVTPQNIYDYIGRIVCATGTYIKPIEIDEALPNVELSSKYKQKNVFGIVCNINTWNNGNVDYIDALNNGWSSGLVDDECILVNSIGEGSIWVVSEILEDVFGVKTIVDPIENGDYITTSDVIGFGCLQKEPTLCNFTVAKITQDETFNDAEEFEYNGKIYRKAFVGCTYHCG